MKDIQDLEFAKFVVNYKIPFPVMLEQAGLEGYRYNGKVYCPFHDNFDTPSAKLYQDDIGDCIYCFSERILYRPADVISKKLLNKSVIKIANKVWEQLSEMEQSEIEGLFGKPKEFMSEEWRKFKDTLDLFKENRINLSQHLDNILSLIE